VAQKPGMQRMQRIGALHSRGRQKTPLENKFF